MSAGFSRLAKRTTAWFCSATTWKATRFRKSPKPTAGVKIFPSRVTRKLNQRVFTSDVSSCATFNGHNDDAVENDLSLLGRADGLLVADLADGVATIGDHDHDLAAAALLQPIGGAS